MKIALALAAIMWSLWSLSKWLSSSVADVLWAIREGPRITRVLQANPTVDDLLAVLDKFNRPRSLANRFRSIPRFGPILWWLQRYPILMIVSVVLIVALASLQISAWIAGLLGASITAGIFYEISYHLVRRLYLPALADIDPSLTVRSVDARDLDWLEASTLRRSLMLFIHDIALAVIAFASLHYAVHSYNNLAYSGTIGATVFDRLMSFAYFSITTFSTTGYGDILAVSTTARLIAIGQMTVGFLYVTFVVILISLTARAVPERGR